MAFTPPTLRVYADTSVFGGCLDEEFARPSTQFFESIRRGLFRLVISDVVLRELEASPQAVQRVLLDLPDECVERVLLSDESAALRDEYMAAGVLGPRWLDDAAHVAIASVTRVDVIVSWNFRHLVRLDRIRQFNAVNLRLSYPMTEIRSPLELPHDQPED